MRRLLGLVAGVALGAPALAGTLTINPNSFGTNADGGEFIATVTDSFLGYSAGDTFRTYCLEINENLRVFQPQYVVVNTEAVEGGVGGGSPDPLDARTAYLFRTYSPLVDSNAEADSLQLAIWHLEDEIVTTDAGALALIADADAWLASNPGAGIGDVRVLNLYDDAALSIHRQDVLASVIPAPAAAVLGALGLGLIARRRNNA